MFRKFFALIRVGVKEAVIGGVSDAVEEIDQRADVGLSVIDEAPTPKLPAASNGRKSKAKVKR